MDGSVHGILYRTLTTIILSLIMSAFAFNYPSTEKNLTLSLLDRYQYHGIYGRPVVSWKELVTVQYGLQLIQILDLDESQQILRTNCWSMYKWHDRLLEWNPKEHGDITVIRVIPDQIWTPDIKLYNFADIRPNEARIARVVVKHTGHLLWVPQAIFQSTCAVEITYFPFDTQICMLEFGSWTYDINQLDIQWWINADTNKSMPYIDFGDYLPSPEWRTDGEIASKLPPDQNFQIKSVKKIRVRRHVNDRGEIVVKNYPVLRYLIKMRRNSDFYVAILVLPCVLLSSLTIVVFWLPPESPAKMMLGMNIFVAFFVLLLLLTDSTPSAVKKFPLIGAFFCLNMVMITLSTFFATIVINLYFHGDSTGPLPRLVRQILIEGLGRLLIIRQSIPLTDPPRKAPRTMIVRKSDPTGKKRTYKVKVPTLTHNKFISTPTSNGFVKSINLSNLDLTIDDSYTSSDDQEYIKEDNDSPLLVGESDPEDKSSRIRSEVRLIKTYIRQFINRQREKRRSNSISMEWRTLALVVDRLFFVLYISCITVAIIVSVPSTTEPEISQEHRD